MDFNGLKDCNRRLAATNSIEPAKIIIAINIGYTKENPILFM